MGINVIITKKPIAKLLSSPNSDIFVMGPKDNSSEANAIKWCLFNKAEDLCSSVFQKVKNTKKVYMLLFKTLIGCLISREESTDQILWDHKHFILYLKNEDKINLSAYIFNHLCKAIKDNTKLCKKNMPYARLLLS